MRWLLTLSVTVSRVSTVSSHRALHKSNAYNYEMGEGRGEVKVFFFGGSIAMSGVITTTPPGAS